MQRRELLGCWSVSAPTIEGKASSYGRRRRFITDSKIVIGLRLCIANTRFLWNEEGALKTC